MAIDKRAQSRKTGELVAAGIRRRIANGELQIGDRLPTEEELTESFGIARTTLREALRILEFQGLIHIRRGRGGGAIVTMPDLERFAEPLAIILQLRATTIGDLDEARILIEPQLASRLAASHTNDDVAVLRRAVAAATTAADVQDQKGFGAAAASIHTVIIERAGNNTLSVLSGLLYRLALDRYTTAALTADQALLHRAVRSYSKLVDLIAEGEAQRAKDHWENHMSWVMSAADDQLLDVYASGDGNSLR